MSLPLKLKLPLPLFQVHPDPDLQRHWVVVQAAVLIMPFSTFIGCVAILVVSLAIWQRAANPLIQSLLNQGLLLLGAWMVIIALFAQHQDYALSGLFNFLPFFVVFIAQSWLIRTPAQLRRLAWLLVLPSVLIALLGFCQLSLNWYFHWQVLNIGKSDGIILDWLVHRGGRPIGRMSSLFYYATVLASYFVITVTLGVGLLVEEWKTRKRALVLMGLGLIVALDAIALVLTDSRNAWGLALGVCLAFAVYLGWRWLVGAVTGAVLAVLMAAYGPSPLGEGLRWIVPRWIWARITDELFLNRPIATLRITQWKFAISMIQQRPLTGWGLRNFTPLYEAQMQFYIGHPHSLPLMLAAEMGIPATLIFYGLIGWVVLSGVLWLRQAPVDWADRTIVFTYLVAFFACTVFSLSDVPIFDARINTMGWLILAGIWGIVLNPKLSDQASN
jgi:O-antigen ligase